MRLLVVAASISAVMAACNPSLFEHGVEINDNMGTVGIINASEQLDADGKRTQAIELLESGLPIFEGDRSFMVTYSAIIG